MRGARVWALAAALAVAGSAFAQGFRRGGFGGPLDLLAMPEVQKELKLEVAQIDLIKQLGQEMAQKAPTPDDFHKMTREERARQFEQMRQEQEKKLAEILESRQMARLKQLSIQHLGITRTLARKDIQDDLRLSADQRARIQVIIDGQGDELRRVFQGFPRGGNMTQDQREEIGRKFLEVLAATEGKLNAVLTDAQKRQYQAMQGAPFKFPERRPGFGPRPRP